MEGKPSTSIAISVVVPFYNEEENVRILYEKLSSVLDNLGKTYEMIFIDDGSKDKTLEILKNIQGENDRVTVIKFKTNFGQTAGIAAGFDFARGDVIIPMDGDLQHDPEDIPKLLEKMEEGYDIVSGWREERKDFFLTRRLPSRIANWLMSKVSGVDIHDFGTTFKAYRKEIIKNIELYGDFHRFIPALASELGASITEVPIKNIRRQRGKSNYNISRTITVFFDLIRIRFLSKYLSMPLQIFGGLGFLLILVGSGILSYLIFLRFVYDLGLMTYRAPLFLLSVFTIVMGVQLFTFGLLGEIIIKFYHKSHRRTVYFIDKIYENVKHEPEKH